MENNDLDDSTSSAYTNIMNFLNNVTE